MPDNQLFFDGLTLVHRFDPEKMGRTSLPNLTRVWHLVCPASYRYRTQRYRFVRFYYINPAHNRAVESNGDMEKVDEDWWLGSGKGLPPKFSS
jgi:hypothetical protein